MIGAEANSSGSNWDPRTKQTHYADRKSDPVSVASLKFKIMMQKCRDNELSQPVPQGWSGMVRILTSIRRRFLGFCGLSSLRL